MVMNNIGIVQNCYMDRNGQPHNEYYFFSANNIRLGGVLLPSNSQYMDAYAARKVQLDRR